MKVFPVHTFNGKHYSLPYELPAGKKGKTSISIEFKPAGSKLPIVSMRNSLFMGLKPTQLLLDSPLGIHHLEEKGVGTWMTSLPQEIEQNSRQLQRARGRVLVGGLGLGLANCYLEADPAVTEIVCIEKNRDLIDLIRPHVPKRKSTIICGDLYQYLETIGGGAGVEIGPFDFAFYDIWCPTGELVLTQHVMPLRRLSRNIVAQENIECWNEEEMLGQIRMHVQMAAQSMDWEKSPIHTMLNAPEEDFQRYKSGQGLNWYFHRWMRQQKPTTEQALAKVEEFMKAIKNPEIFDKEWA